MNPNVEDIYRSFETARVISVPMANHTLFCRDDVIGLSKKSVEQDNQNDKGVHQNNSEPPQVGKYT